MMYKIYSEIEETEILEAYEIEFMRDRRENQKYDITEKKTLRGKRK